MSGPAVSAPPPETLASVADALAWPLMVLRDDASLVHANVAASELLHGRGPFELGPQRHLRPRDRSRRDAFAEAVRDAAAGTRRVLGPHEAGTLCVVSSLGRCAPGTVLLALPAGGPPDVADWAVSHGLTPAETRVLARFVRGERGPAIARSLGIGLATVRSHMLALRQKSGYGSATALLAALLRLPPLR